LGLNETWLRRGRSSPSPPHRLRPPPPHHLLG
jgi:hypothetical protein